MLGYFLAKMQALILPSELAAGRLLFLVVSPGSCTRTM